ncbi:hypothetical protein [Flavobacterium sp. CLA17]|uniref:hypothetical protein n=1 Tax=Flavobacterium sp. CLA17 TaxID=2724135 RepID=UPI0014912DEB|nr:hypothetical protein [Flavobacterium sp. CLA17]QSB25888.1 hypothetical protein HAV12_016085 [Flavobacterium sp. CLA17]
MIKKLTLFLFIVLTSCGGNETKNENTKNEIPKALQDGAAINIGRYRSNDDLPEELYQELVSKNIELKKLETQLEDFNTRDTLNIFYNYNGKSENYYTSAKSYANSIKDSILKNKVLDLLKNSDEKYNKKITELNQLVESIYQKQRDIRDYHSALKIVLTIPLIEKYQKDNLPKKSPFEKVIENQNLLLEKIKKNTPKY